MRRTIRQPLAVAFGLLIVASTALGGAFVASDDVTTVEEASGQLVGAAAADINASENDSIQNAKLAFAIGQTNYNTFVEDPDTSDLEKSTANDTKQAIYDQSSIQATNNNQTLGTYSTYLNDTQTIALLEGKNAYIQALENGASESVAREQASEAVADYYSAKQQNLIAAWNTTATLVNSSAHTAQSTSNVGSKYVAVNNSMQGYEEQPVSGTGVSTETLANATSAPVKTVLSEWTSPSFSGTATISITSGEFRPNQDAQFIAAGFLVEPPNQNYTRLNVASFSDFNSSWTEIETQNTEVQSQLDTFITNTYSNYQQGDINTTELVDPYLNARDYDPQISDTWALRSLSAMGADTPSNLSTVAMNVSVGGTNHSGVLVSDSTPSGGFVVGESYDTANLTGSQFVVIDDGATVHLAGSFTVEAAETGDGDQYSSGETVEYSTLDYATANISEFQALQSGLETRAAEINARQQQNRGGGGGAGWLPDGIGIKALAPAVVIGGAAVLLLKS